jgi:hypothetical protein
MGFSRFTHGSSFYQALKKSDFRLIGVGSHRDGGQGLVIDLAVRHVPGSQWLPG